MNWFQVMTSCVGGEWRLLEVRLWSRMPLLKSSARMGKVLGLLVSVV